MDVQDKPAALSINEICDKGEAWKKTHANKYKELAAGTSVIIEVTTGEFVTARSRLAAHDAFASRFPNSTSQGYAFDVNRPVFVGGGFWLK